MPRNASGTYSLPSGNPVSSGTLIDATWANNTLNDIANEMTDSLSRSGEGGMLAPFRLNDGVQATPGLAFTNEPSTGMYRAGTNEAWLVAGGTQVLQFTTNGAAARFAAGAVGTPSITALGDLNTGLWFPAADTVALSTGGVEALRVNSSGNVGIGTASPAYPLHVVNAANGIVAVQGGSGTNQGGAFFVRNAAASGTIYAFGDRARVFGGTPEATASIFTSTQPLTFDINSSERMRLDASGNLGIGTASPSQRLEVNGNIAVGGSLGTTPSLNRGIFVQSNTNNDVVGYSLYVNDGANNRRGSMFLDDATGLWGWDVTSSSGTPSYVWRVATAEVMRLTDTGNLGIGTASPAHRLSVNGTSSLGGSVNSCLIQDGIFAVGVASISANSGASLHIGTAGANSLNFYANNIERLRIESNGSLLAGRQLALATNATDGFLYIPTCAGTPTGTPTAITGMAPIVVNTTNNKLYFYSGGAWRDAGP